MSAQLDLALGESAMAAIRCKDTYLAAQYQRLRSRCGHRKALGAVKHSTICTHRGAAGRAAGLRSPPPDIAAPAAAMITAASSGI